MVKLILSCGHEVEVKKVSRVHGVFCPKCRRYKIVKKVVY